MGIVVIGAVFVDIKGYPLSTYIPGGRNAGRIEQVHGGVSRNVAEDIANVELRPTFVGLVDDTGMGQDVIDKLDNHKVNTRYIQKVPDGMGTWLAIFDNDGDVHAAISKRPDTTPLTTLLEEKGDEIFKDCDAIAIELDLEKDTVKQVLRYARKYNKKVFAAVSNMSIAMERRDYLQQIDCFVCNQQEAGLLFSDDYEHLAPSQMAQVLARFTVFGMQFLDFFDFLTNSVMMPIAAITICLLVSRVIGVEKIEEEVTLEGKPFRRKRIFNFMIKYLCPIFAAIILISSVANALGVISM